MKITLVLNWLKKFGLKKENLEMNNQTKLEEQLNKFLFGKKAEGFVISIQGHWGIGKTYFWNNYIEKREQGDKFVNISLFGIHSVDDIKKKILIEISVIAKIGDFTKTILGKSKYEGIDLASMLSLLDKKDFKNIIICFDDFERISPNLSMSEILGFISELKEKYNCKIVLINNNDTLKEQDTLNHKKIIKRVTSKNKKEVEDKEKFIITSTNNEEIFNKYIEKIVDVTLWYEPTLEDIFEIISELNKEKKYIDFIVLKKLFSQLSNRDKKFNIRLIKQVVLKLELLEPIFIELDINEKIKNGFFLNIFKLVVKENISINDLNIPIVTPYNFDKEIFINIVKKHQVDIENFQEKIKNYNDYLNNREYDESLYNKIKELYFQYLYELKYENKKFSEDFYKLLSTPNVDIVKLLSYISFASYIKFIKKLDSENDDKYQKLFIEKSKEYIKNNIQYLDIDRLYENNKFTEELDKNNELRTFYEKEKEKIKIDKSLDINIVKDLIRKKLESNGWNHKEELLLASINDTQHKKWLIEDREYFELTYEFIGYLQSISGTKPFNGFYSKTINIYKELYQNEKYKNKIDVIVQRFSIEIEK